MKNQRRTAILVTVPVLGPLAVRAPRRRSIFCPAVCADAREEKRTHGPRAGIAGRSMIPSSEGKCKRSCGDWSKAKSRIEHMASTCITIRTTTAQLSKATRKGNSITQTGEFPLQLQSSSRQGFGHDSALFLAAPDRACGAKKKVDRHLSHAGNGIG